MFFVNPIVGEMIQFETFFQLETPNLLRSAIGVAEFQPKFQPSTARGRGDACGLGVKKMARLVEYS